MPLTKSSRSASTAKLLRLDIRIAAVSSLRASGGARPVPLPAPPSLRYGATYLLLGADLDSENIEISHYYLNIAQQNWHSLHISLQIPSLLTMAPVTQFREP